MGITSVILNTYWAGPVAVCLSMLREVDPRKLLRKLSTVIRILPVTQVGQLSVTDTHTIMHSVLVAQGAPKCLR